MKHVFQSGIFLAAILLSSGVFSTTDLQKPPEAPQSPEATKARMKFEEEFNKLNAEFTTKLTGLRQQYIKDLDSVRKKALEKEDLDEAQRLLEEKRRVAAGSQPGMTKGMGILCALWGIEDRWVDVTHPLRAAVQNSQLRFQLNAPNPLSGVPDVAPGARKTLMIAYMFDGKPYLSITRDDQPVDLPPAK